MILDPEIMDFGLRPQTRGNQPVVRRGLAREENYYFCPLTLDLGSWTLDSMDLVDFVDLSLCLDAGSWIMDPLI